MSRELNFKKGDRAVIAVVPMSNVARRYRDKGMSLDNINEWTAEVEVITVTKKYITVESETFGSGKYEIDMDYREKVNAGGSNYKLYNNLQEIIDEVRYNKLYSEIKAEFGKFEWERNLTLDKLERIKAIIEE